MADAINPVERFVGKKACAGHAPERVRRVGSQSCAAALGAACTIAPPALAPPLVNAMAATNMENIRRKRKGNDGGFAA
jgi:hypothetical protein